MPPGPSREKGRRAGAPRRLNGDDHPEVVARYGVMGFPTLNLYRGGEVVRQIVGAKPKRRLLADLDGLI